MAKLMDIKGYWDTSYNSNFNEQNMWKGRILLDEDGWFEGIVIDSESPYTNDRLVFGVYLPEKAIDLLKVSPPRISNPFIFRGTRDANGYEGNFAALTWFGERPFGVSHIITQDVEYAKQTGTPDVAHRDIEEEKKELSSRITAFKENGYFSDLYENTRSMKSEISQGMITDIKKGKRKAREINKN